MLSFRCPTITHITSLTRMPLEHHESLTHILQRLCSQEGRYRAARAAKKIEYFRNLTLTIINVIDIIGCYQGYRVPQSVSRGDQNSPRSSVQSARARAGLVEASESRAVAG